MGIGGLAALCLGGLMLDAEEPCCSCRLLQLEPEAALLPPLVAASPAAAPPLAAPMPPAVKGIGPSPCGPLGDAPLRLLRPHQVHLRCHP
jgi:hypothetical protein